MSAKISNVVRFSDNTRARQNTNRDYAVALAKIGVAVFPSSGKTPLIPLYNRLDTEITPEDREASIDKYKEDHDDKTPIHVGATKDPETVKRMWRAFRDAVPSIACGPTGIVVFDADSKDDGPSKMAALFEENGGLPEGALASPTKSDGRHFIFADPDRTFTNKAGLLKKNHGTDVRGAGGQIVAPGSLLDDGRSYGTKADLGKFMRAIVHKTLPLPPEYLRDLIGASPEGETPLSDSDPTVKTLLEQLGAHAWPDFEIAFDPAIGWSLESLREHAPDFGDLYDAPGDDRSTNRFKAARYLVGAYPDMTILDYAAFCREWDGAGDEYDTRQLAREFAKAKAAPAHVSFCTGEAFGPVVDEDDQPQQSRSYVRDSYLVANYKPIRWLVKRLIPLNSVGALYGLPNVGKSFVVFDLANHARRERNWLGRKVKGGDVLYLYAEGAEGIAGRAKAWADSNDASGGNVALMNGVPNLFSDAKASKKIIAAARECEAESGQPVRLIIVDTLAAATTGADGSSDRDMGLVCDRLRKVADELDCAVLVVHHSGKDVTKGMRGSSAILGAVDYSLLVEETKGVSSISVEKMRDARKGQSIKFKLVEVVIGVDEDGENVTSCIVRPVEVGEAMSAVDEDEEVPPLKVPDRREDRVAMLVEVAREEAEKAAAEDEPLAEIGLSVPSLVEAINIKRGDFSGLDGKPLAPLNRKAVWRVVETAVEADQMETRSSKVFLKA